MSQPWLDRFWCIDTVFVRGNDFPTRTPGLPLTAHPEMILWSIGSVAGSVQRGASATQRCVSAASTIRPDRDMRQFDGSIV